MFYTRKFQRTLFLLPTMAIGMEEDGRPFIELGWLVWSIGVGAK